MKKPVKATVDVAAAAAENQSCAPLSNVQPRTDAKQAKVIALLQREQGASIAEMQEATGWLPHTTRAALTGLRKRGLTIEKTKVDGVTRYKAVATQ